jgi:hypothetical protein
LLIQNSQTINPVLSMRYFQELISEMQNEEPYTLSYVRTLHMFKDDSIPAIFTWTLDLFQAYIENIETEHLKIVPVIDTLISCLSFNSSTIGKINDKNAFKSVRLSNTKDIYNGKLEWGSREFIEKLIKLFELFTQK